ncbi:hypothetical protein BLNAU_24330 [Blattamonas nauphoetae]|uniref:Uncharacterized protein n=1 Tax=Blattamonas nauphoetae TaxID=2049346 RepID=A0ABQ9WMS5_9EUKA|nr:hypothetical protein BLNAU_24330 [Blattamonas nauphoetae]
MMNIRLLRPFEDKIGVRTEDGGTFRYDDQIQHETSRKVERSLCFHCDNDGRREVDDDCSLGCRKDRKSSLYMHIFSILIPTLESCRDVRPVTLWKRTIDE